ncbi:MAG: ArnT family glycosyltransferase [Anaerolineae bacterium]
MTEHSQQAAPSAFLGLRMTEGRWLAVIIVLAVLLRLGVALYLGDVVDAPPLLTDQRSYHALGQRLLGGHGYSFDRNWYPFTPAETPTAHWSFLYSLVVAAVYAVFGPHPLAVRIVQGVLGGVALPWLAYRLAKRLLPQRQAVPFLAALLTAGYPYLALYAATLMTETLFIGLVLWTLEISLRIEAEVRAGRAVPLRDAALLGSGLGLAVLTRQSLMPWLPVLFLWLLWRARQGHSLKPTFRALALAGAIIVALVIPWTYRNYRVYGEFLLLNSNSGYAMYSAQHPFHGTVFHEFTAAPVPSDLAGLNEAQKDATLMRRGIQFVLDEPGRYLMLCLSRVRAYLEFWPTTDTSLLHNLGRVGSFGLLLPFALIGLVMTLRNPGLASGGGLIVLFVVFYSAMHILTWAMVRYRLPVDATIMPLAALAVESVYRRARVVWSVRSRPANLATPRIDG